MEISMEIHPFSGEISEAPPAPRPRWDLSMDSWGFQKEFLQSYDQILHDDLMVTYCYIGKTIDGYWKIRWGFFAIIMKYLRTIKYFVQGIWDWQCV